jgi:hypothetical protein
MAYTTINKSGDYFNTKLYTGNGGTQSITGVGFQSDFTWIKRRDTTNNHRVTDVIRGVTKEIYPDDPSAQDTRTGGLTAFGSDGFTVGDSAGYNANSGTYASWNWKANGQGSSNTDGSINTTYTSVNTTAGFSISKYTGTGSTATVGHGLGVTPKMIIFKNTSSSVDWRVYHEALGNTHRLCLNDTSASTNDDSAFNDTSPTSTVFTVGGSSSTNAGTMIAYCFAEKTGYSKFGSYTGNGSTDGTFVYTGFKPAFIMVKEYANAGRNWVINDNKRDPFNECTNGILPNSNAAESTGYKFDLLSNGFKPRTTGSGENASGFQYIYMAFASAPLVGTNNIPATAR